ncbi:Fur family transcriptional regulator [Sphingomonas sp. EC-HK361]|uniref:Fur family transcriptional regulator n=1 Tax=Sphingomonas sp. EC-HK361 TaxID=2038397 RepID=UPI0012559C5F|nr:transcriptional repressor [Sphingomonas sp. EC-HK361]VVT18753.1 Fur family transcriptional regulator [Sphingomonas sp. EC-HK361]
MADRNHKHHEPQGAALAGSAQAALERAGERWTPLRAAVFAALTKSAKPASAYDVTEAVSHAEGRRIAANSVYRILDLLVAANVARRVESANAYIANAHPDCLHDCIFLVCDSCGGTTHIDDDRISDEVRDSAAAAGFMAKRPVLEVRGVCRDCDGGEAAKAEGEILPAPLRR